VHIEFVATTRHEEKKRQDGERTMAQSIELMPANEYRALVNKYFASMQNQDAKTIRARIYKAECATFQAGHPIERGNNTKANRTLWAHYRAIIDASEQCGVRS
jgi:hypothetical protein